MLPDIYTEVQYLTIGTFHGTIKLSLLRKLGEGSGIPLQYSCLGNPMDGGAWWAAVMGLLRVGHDWVTSLSCFEEGNDNPLQCSCLENPRDGGAWWAAIYGVAQSQTRLKWLSISSSIEKTLDFPGEGAVKNPLTMQETRGQSLDQEDHLQNEMVTHFSTILVWEIPGTEGPGKL